MQCRTVTNQLKARKHPVTLVRGKGYFYFVYDNGVKYADKSVYVCRLSDLTLDRWIAEGEDFAKEVEA